MARLVVMGDLHSIAKAMVSISVVHGVGNGLPNGSLTMFAFVYDPRIRGFIGFCVSSYRCFFLSEWLGIGAVNPAVWCNSAPYR